MNLRQIQELIKFVAKSGATEVDLEIGDIKLSIKSPPKGKLNINENQSLSLPATPPSATPPSATPPSATPPSATPPPNISDATKIVNEQKNVESEEADSILDKEEDKYITIKAPIIGTFYRRPSPDKDSFVNVGDKIDEGSVLCIIEAMKLFNEIESEFKGTIVKVLVEDMSPVEYDQPLFLVDPS